MVRRTRLLLTALLLGGAALLAGCPAEQLGVELPKGGPDAVSQEDLRRDTWLVQQAGSPATAAAGVARRFGEMRLLPAFGSDWVRSSTTGEGSERVVACGRKDGASKEVQLVIAVGDPGTAAGAVTWAGAVSVAKGWDVRGVPARSRVLCVANAEDTVVALLGAPPVPLASLSDIVLIDALHGLVLEGRPDTIGDLPLVRHGAPGPTPAEVGAVDYRRVEQAVRDVVTRLGPS